MLARFSTLVDALRYHALERPHDTAITFLKGAEREGASWTYQDLDRRATEIATSLRALNLAGKNAILIHPPGLEFIAALFGCFYAGVTAVPTYPLRFRSDNRADARSIALIEDAKPAVVLSTEANVAKARRLERRATGLAGPLWLATDGPGFRGHGDLQLPAVNPDLLAMLQYTSGSTRSPRGVMLTHRNLIDNQRVIADHMRHSTQSCMVSWLPPYHDMGLIGGILQPITVGFPLTLMEPAHVLQTPLRWLQTISRIKATTSGAPNAIFELCVQKIPAEALKDLDLSSWRVAFNGSEPIRSDTLKRFTEFFAACGFPSDGFFPCYGLAECTLLMAGRTGTRIEALERSSIEQLRVSLRSGGAPVVSCGKPGLGFQVAIVDPKTGRECEENRIGEIWASSASVARGYWDRPDETDKIFENALPGRIGRFLRTGDLGFVLDGELFVTGRIKDLIIIRGRNFYPQDIEGCAGFAHSAVLPDGCVAFGVDGLDGEQMVVACEIRRERRHRIDAAALIQAIREAIAEEFEIRVSTIHLLKPASLPRTTSGKLRRDACRQAFLEGKLEVVGEDPKKPRHTKQQSTSLGDRIRHELAAVLNVSEYSFDDEKPLSRQGLDSAARVESFLRLELAFGIQLDPNLINLEITLKDLIRAIDHALTARPERFDTLDPLSMKHVEDRPSGAR
jgi:acyl-CoA synthetase (AMP-forming)/AMP-acid ligase II/acyl carrier protein